ncbi:unnamed protein product [Clavelina lepadiformis]|uniref:Sodium channel protein n=1 Tax=Clavelina lepadiformis TaxID=159417 RepID=A0ABP0G163_CLALP
MTHRGSNEDESDLYVRFTEESLTKLVQRKINLQANNSTEKNSTAKQVILRGVDDLWTPDFLDKFDEAANEPDPSLEDGQELAQANEKFPQELYDEIIEEVDPYYKNRAEETFCVVTRRFGKNVIYRFTATRGFFIFSPFNSVRQWAIRTILHPAFDAIVMAVILINCVFLALDNEIEYAEYVFTALYTLEMVIKMIARGLILKSHTYLRDPWNWLDFVVVILAYATISISTNVSSLRTFRVFRAFKSVSLIPGLKTIVNSLFHSMKPLAEVMLIMIFLLIVVALIALQAYQGVLRRRCVTNPPPNLSDNNWATYVANSANWNAAEGETVVCGNETGAGGCPAGFVCLPDVADNPNYGYTNFDHMGYAMLTSFQLLTLDFWENVYNMIIRAEGPWNILFFLMSVFLGPFYLLNLLLAVVAIAYSKENEKQSKLEEMRARAKEKPKIKQRRKKLLQERKKISQLTAITDNVENSTMVSIADVVAVARLSKTSSLGSLTIMNENAITNLSLPQQESRSSMKRLSMLKNSGNNVSIDSSDSTTAEPSFLQKLKAQANEHLQRCSLLCPPGFNWFQRKLLKVINNKIFDMIIILSIIINTIFLAIDHHGISHELENALDIGNKVFTAVFLVEACLKILAMGPITYLCDVWNIFDFVIVFISIIELILDLTQTSAEGTNLTVLRTLRLLRVFRLARKWGTMQKLVSIIWKSFGAVSNLTIVLFLILYIFAVIGKQLYSERYASGGSKFDDGQVPRWNFTDFYHSFLLVWRVMCGEWIEPLYDCLFITEDDWLCIPFFLIITFVANFMILNLFTAILLEAFSVDELKVKKEKKDSLKTEEKDGNNMPDIDDALTLTNGIERSEGGNFPNKTDGRSSRTTSLVDEVGGSSNDQHTDKNTQSEENTEKKIFNTKRPPLNRQQSVGYSSTNGTKLSPIGTIPEDSEYVTAIDSKTPTENQVDQTTTTSSTNDGKHKEDVAAPDCLPQWFLKRNPHLRLVPRNGFCCYWQCVRKACFLLVKHPIFEGFILFLILSSTVCLALEDIYLEQDPVKKAVLKKLEYIFTALFILEMLLKWIGFGPTKYFTNFWCVLDFAIVAASLTGIILEETAQDSQTGAFRSLRTLRALRPLRAVSRWEGMRIVVNALIYCIPSIANVLCVCLLIWFVFGIMGVQFFKGRFFRCVDADDNPVNYTIASNQTECINRGYAWFNPNINFDNVLTAMVALFQVATFEGWIEIMADASDVAGVNQQPQREASQYNTIFFVFFVLVGSFFILNLIVGVIIESFQKLRNKTEVSAVEALLTDNQKNFYKTMKTMLNRKPKKSIPKPENQWQLYAFDLVTNNRFELVIFFLIFMNMITLSMEHYEMSDAWRSTLRVTDITFTALFSLEAALKLIGMRHHYFRDIFNVFDFFVILVSITGFILENLVALDVSPTLLRVVRVFRVFRVLRVVRAARGIRRLILTLIISIPALFNIAVLLSVFIIIFAILGVTLFMDVKLNGALNDQVNFQTFGNALMVLFRLVTSAGWNDVLDPLMNTRNCTDTGVPSTNPQGCGDPIIAVLYFVFYIFIVFLVIVNMYIAIILDNFDEILKQDESGVSQGDFETFYMVWGKYDPQASQFVTLTKLSDLLHDLHPPFQLAKPNSIKIGALGLPVLDGDKVHCLDVLYVLVKRILGDVELSDEMKKEAETRLLKSFPNRRALKAETTTLVLRQRTRAANVIQDGWKTFATRRERPAIANFLHETDTLVQVHQNNRKLTKKQDNNSAVSEHKPSNDVFKKAQSPDDDVSHGGGGGTEVQESVV